MIVFIDKEQTAEANGYSADDKDFIMKISKLEVALMQLLINAQPKINESEKVIELGSGNVVDRCGKENDKYYIDFSDFAIECLTDSDWHCEIRTRGNDK